MIAITVSRDGEKQCTAGVADLGVTSVILSCVRRVPRDASGEPGARQVEEELMLEVGGLMHDPDGARVHLVWLREPVQPGQQVTLTIVETAVADPPAKRDREDPGLVERKQRAHYERLKRAYEP